MPSGPIDKEQNKSDNFVIPTPYLLVDGAPALLSLLFLTIKGVYQFWSHPNFEGGLRWQQMEKHEVEFLLQKEITKPASSYFVEMDSGNSFYQASDSECVPFTFSEVGQTHNGKTKIAIIKNYRWAVTLLGDPRESTDGGITNYRNPWMYLHAMNWITPKVNQTDISAFDSADDLIEYGLYGKELVKYCQHDEWWAGSPGYWYWLNLGGIGQTPQWGVQTQHSRVITESAFDQPIVSKHCQVRAAVAGKAIPSSSGVTETYDRGWTLGWRLNLWYTYKWIDSMEFKKLFNSQIAMYSYTDEPKSRVGLPVSNQTILDFV